jgi:hypothetical protein
MATAARPAGPRPPRRTQTTTRPLWTPPAGLRGRRHHGIVDGEVVEFIWSGDDEVEETGGDRWAELQSDGILEGRICVQGGDEAGRHREALAYFFNSLLVCARNSLSLSNYFGGRSVSVQILYAVPVGAIIAWYPPGSAALPPGFALCNGDIVNDPDSPFNNLPTPDLTGRFILGSSKVTTPPATGGSVDMNLNGFTNPAYTLTTGSTQASSSDNVTNDVIIRNYPNDGQYRYGMVGDGDGWQDGNHHHVAPVDSLYVPAPGWLALLFIMRIK